ncbi:MAG TPA: PAS domain-containing protein, partial [Oculatellaceae cyanobacterium]
MYPDQNLDIILKAAFDDLPCSAAYTYQPLITPLLCPINDRRWWFKSQVSLDPTLTGSCLALCAETMLQLERWKSDLLMFQDTLAEQRLATCRCVTSKEKLKFYSDALLLTPQEVILGILSALDCVAPELTLRQQEALVPLSRQAISARAGYANVQLEVHQNLTNRQRTVNKRYQENKSLQASHHQGLADIKLALEQYALVSTSDHTGKINYVNDQFCKISQYSREQLLGANHHLINSSYHSPNFFKQMWATISSAKVWKGEIRNRAKDGSFYWMDTTIVPILNSQGKPYKYMSICHDITAAKQVQEERVNKTTNHGDRFFDLSPDLLCVVDL